MSLGPIDVTTWQIRTSVDVTSWSSCGEETRGRRTKRWVNAPDGSVWLRKEPRPGRPNEIGIEVFTLGLARACGLNAAEGRPAWWREDLSERRGICVLKFLELEEDLVHGYEILSSVDGTYDPDNVGKHTIRRALDALQTLETRYGVDLVGGFVDMLSFDAWVGNTDRHQGNWGVIRSRLRGLRLAPVYDTAACLGAELRDANDKTLATFDDPAKGPTFVDRYVERCPSGFGDDSSLISMANLVESLRNVSGIRARMRQRAAVFRTVHDQALRPLMSEVDDVVFPRRRKAFASCILTRRLAWLEEILR